MRSSPHVRLTRSTSRRTTSGVGSLRVSVLLCVAACVFAGLAGANNELPGAKTLMLKQPAPSDPPARHFRLRAPKQMGPGTILYFYGRGWLDGRVVARYRWGTGAWHVFATRQTSRGRYSVKLDAIGRGRLGVRISFPGGSTGNATIAVD